MKQLAQFPSEAKRASPRLALAALAIALGMTLAAPMPQAAPIAPGVQQAIDRAAADPAALAAVVAAAVAADPAEATEIVAAAVKANPAAAAQIAAAAAKAAPGQAVAIAFAAIAALPLDQREAGVQTIIAAVELAVPQASGEIAAMLPLLNRLPYRPVVLSFAGLDYAPPPASPR
jgi:hypothetical protein